jgi:hypothetical protein
MSSGVNHFKSVRGGEHLIEYDVAFLCSVASLQKRIWKDVEQRMAGRIRTLSDDYLTLLTCLRQLRATREQLKLL